MKTNLSRFTEEKEGNQIVYFLKEELRENFISRSLKFWTNPEGRIEKAQLVSSDHGELMWNSEDGITSVRMYEESDSIHGERISHFPTLLLSTSEDFSHAKLIVTDLCDNISDLEFKETLSEMIFKPGPGYVLIKRGGKLQFHIDAL